MKFITIFSIVLLYVYHTRILAVELKHTPDLLLKFSSNRDGNRNGDRDRVQRSGIFTEENDERFNEINHNDDAPPEEEILNNIGKEHAFEIKIIDPNKRTENGTGTAAAVGNQKVNRLSKKTDGPGFGEIDFVQKLVTKAIKMVGEIMSFPSLLE